MPVEENDKAIVATRNMDWQITPGPDGTFSDSQVAHSLLKDIRENTNSIRKMMVFFTWLVAVACAVSTIWLLLRA